MDSLQKKIVALKTELEALWADDHEVAYELTSVFIHRGNSPSWGHYFFYSRNLPGQPEQWFKYNDSDVTVVDKSEVFADTTGDTANPYLVSRVINVIGHLLTNCSSSSLERVPRSSIPSSARYNRIVRRYEIS